MKNLASLIILTFFSYQIAIAQAPPTPPTPPKASEASSSSFSTSFSETKINMDMGDNQKLKLKVNDHDFDMDLDFERFETVDIRGLLTKHLGKPKASFRGTEEWSDQNKTYKVKLRKGSLEASFDKDELTDKEFEQLLSFAKDVFVELNWDIDVEGW